MLSVVSLGRIGTKIGVAEEAFLLFISLLISYPICIIFNKYLLKQNNNIKHVYYLICGLLLVYFNFGSDIIHSLITCLVCYLVLKLFNIKIAVVINFLFTLIYLLIGCYSIQIGSNYSIKWTLPHCVLTLRLIAISFDIYDGFHNQKINISKDEKENDKKNVKLVQNEESAITSMPTLLEFLSHSYFPATILVGPLIPYNNYIKYIESNVNHWDKCWKLAAGRLLIGLFYLAVYQIGSYYWPIDFLISEKYSESSFWYKATAMAVVTKVCMCKYLMSWLISEGACIASGVSWDGKTYYSCSNIHVFKFETTPTFGGIIKSFNLTTNNFAFKYIFKRLKFLGNRTLSQALTLIFLAIWHGLETGYFVTFMLEFLIMKMEVEVINKFNSLCAKNMSLNRIMRSFVAQWIIYIFFRIYTIYLLGYSFVPFMLLQFGLWYPVYSQAYFYGHIITISWVFISFFV